MPSLLAAAAAAAHVVVQSSPQVLTMPAAPMAAVQVGDFAAKRTVALIAALTASLIGALSALVGVLAAALDDAPLTVAALFAPCHCFRYCC